MTNETGKLEQDPPPPPETTTGQTQPRFLTPEERLEMQNLVDNFTADNLLLESHRNFIVNATENTSIGVVEARRDECQIIKARCDQNVIRSRAAMLSKQGRDHINVEIQKYYDLIWNTIGLFQDHLKAFGSFQQPPVPQPSQSSPKVKYPAIAMPEFDGNLDNWIGFRDRFDSLVNKNIQLSDIDRFNYLLASVKLPAGQTSVLKNFPLSEVNYQAAWKALCDRYDDRQKLKSHQFNAMLSMKKMTAETGPELRRIIDDFNTCFSTLDLLNATYEDLRVHVVLFRLDEQTRKDWQKFIGDEEQTWLKLHEFLVKQWKTVVAVPEAKKSSKSDQKPSTSKSFSSTTATTSPCPLCREAHPVYRCQKFKSMSVNDRANAVNSHKLCRNCLSPTHIKRMCTSANRCKICNQPHHSMIHYDRQSYPAPAIASDSDKTTPCVTNSALNAASSSFVPAPVSREAVSPATSSNLLASSNEPTRVEALLSTVSILALDSSGMWLPCRALLDSGSQSNWISEDFAKRLGIQLHPTKVKCNGINGQTSIVQHWAAVEFSSRTTTFSGTADCLVSKDIVGILPHHRFEIENFKLPPNIKLADPEFNIPGQVDLLFGVGIFHRCLLPETIQLDKLLVLRASEFGFIIGGEFEWKPSKSTFISCFMQQATSGDDELDQKLDKFLELENYDSQKKLLSPSDAFCLDLFKKTTRRDDSGRFVVQYPFNDNLQFLGTNLPNATRQFFYQEGVRLRNPEMNTLYIDYITNLINRDILSEVSATAKHEGHFLPHHGVLRMKKTTTQVRPVVNGSSKSETGRSLNDCLHRGPTVQSDIFDILIRFREGAIALKFDIEKMYLQVSVDPEHRKWQKVLWRESPNLPLRHYEFNSVTFGLKCSPYLATQCLTTIADENAEVFPLAAFHLKHNTYVDDGVFSCKTKEEGTETCGNLQRMLENSCFPARKWSSNDRSLFKNLPGIDMESLDTTSVIKTLGVLWSPADDKFSFDFSFPETIPSTKAEILSEIASLHDPLGILAPVVLKAKLHMKPLRLMKWTDKVDEDELRKWCEFRSELHFLKNVTIHRHAIVKDPVEIQLHGFSDAAEPGYGAAVYLRSMDSQGNVKVSLLCAKSRVSPPKQKSIPRMELCAATLLAKLVHKLTKILTISINSVFLWTDSMIVLYWIPAIPATLSTFVGNRTSVIQEFTSNFVWKHCRGSLNPSDDVTRGLMPSEIVNRQQWWFGPDFLQLPEEKWPKSLLTIQEDDPEVQKEIKKSLAAVKTSDLFTFIEDRFSSFKKIINCIGYINRFATKRMRDNTGAITTDEAEIALETIVKVLQKTLFPQEVKFFEEKRSDPATKFTFPKTSPLLQLTPFLDERGIICVGGRLQASKELSSGQKHQMLLPRCNFVKVLVREIHLEHLHPAQSTMLAHVRQQFWPLNARSTIRQVERECIICFRAKPTTAEQLMSQLPEARIKSSPPFQSTALDYAGPLNIRTSLTRKTTTTKCYVALFKCMATGAIHLEAVTSLSTPAFISTLDRFVSRRGLCAEIFSDNGTQFVGADNEFQEEIEEHLRNKGIKWHFTTPAAPHAGGYYESGIKSMKRHLIRECAGRSFDFEQLSTLLCKIEAVLNSRPLTPMSNDPNDFEVLTPGHFLVGRPLTAKPERKFLNIATTKLDRFNQLQQIQQKFWSRWYHEYLHTLQTRPNRFRQQNEFHIDDLVLLKDNNLPTMKWSRGRIIKLFPDKAGVVRNVLVKTQNGEKTRNIRYLCFLPNEDPTPSRPQSV
jgi:transposase InsO family protein